MAHCQYCAEFGYPCYFQVLRLLRLRIRGVVWDKYGEFIVTDYIAGGNIFLYIPSTKL